jgi:hypothetical protein
MTGTGQLPPGRSLDDILSLDEAAAWLRMNPRTLLLHTKGRNPRVPAIRISRKDVRFHPRTILKALTAP